MQSQVEKKCKWCGQPVHNESRNEGYCGNTCVIAAMKENPQHIRRLRIRQISLIIGTFYSLLLCLIDGNLNPNTVLFYASAGALIGYFIGFGLGWGLYILHEQNHPLLNKKLFAK